MDAGSMNRNTREGEMWDDAVSRTDGFEAGEVRLEKGKGAGDERRRAESLSAVAALRLQIR
jgi:hypothetical protein